MIAGLGTTELLIILVIVLLVFGVGRISKLGSELGTGIRAFRDGMRQEELTSDRPEEEEKNSHE